MGAVTNDLPKMCIYWNIFLKYDEKDEYVTFFISGKKPTLLSLQMIILTYMNDGRIRSALAK